MEQLTFLLYFQTNKNKTEVFKPSQLKTKRWWQCPARVSQARVGVTHLSCRTAQRFLFGGQGAQASAQRFMGLSSNLATALEQGGWSQFLGDRALPSYFASTFSVIEQTLYLGSEFVSEFGISIKFTYAQIFFFTLVIKISATILNSKWKTNKPETARCISIWKMLLVLLCLRVTQNRFRNYVGICWGGLLVLLFS